MYSAKESSSFMEVAVRRPTTLVHPSPAIVYISTADGDGEMGATSADTLTKTAYFKSFAGAELVFGANVYEVRRNISLTSRYDPSCQTAAYGRVGVDDDRYLKVNIQDIWSRHGTSS